MQLHVEYVIIKVINNRGDESGYSKRNGGS